MIGCVACAEYSTDELDQATGLEYGSVNRVQVRRTEYVPVWAVYEWG